MTTDRGPLSARYAQSTAKGPRTAIKAVGPGRRLFGSLLLVASLASVACGSSEDRAGSYEAEENSSSPKKSPQTGPEDRPAPSNPGTTDAPLASGKVFTLVTYNIAGLPQQLTGSKASTHIPLMGPKLNPFDLVLVQEDFAYHDKLVAGSTHPYKSNPKSAKVDLGDGLNILSRYPFSGDQRTKWKDCNGTVDQKNDCLTSKGFYRVTFELEDGRAVDVYDVHFDAGRSSGDAKAREKQVTQLVDAIAEGSADRAVVVAGDTNMKAADEGTFLRLLSGAGLTCACRALHCLESDRIDRVLFRSSKDVSLTAKSIDVLTFVDDGGNPLSDHEPVRVELVVDAK